MALCTLGMDYEGTTERWKTSPPAAKHADGLAGLDIGLPQRA